MKEARLDFMGQLFGELLALVPAEHTDRATVLSQSLAHQIDRALADSVEYGKQIEAARAALEEADREIAKMQAEHEQGMH
jgi:hypothetical protein